MTQFYRYGLLGGLLYLTIAAAGSYDPERPELVAFGFDGFEPGINRLISEGDAKEKLLRRFGEPQQVESTTQWEHAGLIQTKTWHYEGLTIVTMRPVDSSQHWLRKITLTSPVYPLKFGLSIGANKHLLPGWGHRTTSKRDLTYSYITPAILGVKAASRYIARYTFLLALMRKIESKRLFGSILPIN